jgi:hypothetical protein
VNASLEFNGRPVTFDAKIGLATDETGEPLVSGEQLTICAWHDKDKKLTRLVEDAGYKTSHGICQKCLDGLKLPAVS